MPSNKTLKNSPEFVFIASELERIKLDVKKQILESIYARIDKSLQDEVGKIKSDLNITISHPQNGKSSNDLKAQVIESTRVHLDSYVDKKIQALRRDMQAYCKQGTDTALLDSKNDLQSQVVRQLYVRIDEMVNNELDRLRAETLADITKVRNDLKSQVLHLVYTKYDDVLGDRLKKISAELDSRFQTFKSKVHSQILEKFREEASTSLRVEGQGHAPKPVIDPPPVSSAISASVESLVNAEVQRQNEGFHKRQKKHMNNMCAKLEDMEKCLSILSQKIGDPEKIDTIKSHLEIVESKVLKLVETSAHSDKSEVDPDNRCAGNVVCDECLTMLKKDVTEISEKTNNSTDNAPGRPDGDDVVEKSVATLNERLDETQRALAIQVNIATATWMNMTSLHHDIEDIRNRLIGDRVTGNLIPAEDLISFDDMEEDEEKEKPFVDSGEDLT